MRTFFKTTPTSRLFILFCVLHVILWVSVSYFLRATLPHDVAEAVTWGLQGQWGYDKHPPLNAWICALFFKMGGVFGVYLWAQLAVILSFIAVWKLARKVLPEWHSLFAVIALEGINYFTLATPNITPDTLQTPLWAWTTYVFFNALEKKRYRDWILLSLFTALTLLTKYQGMILFASMFMVLLATETGRKSFFTPLPYLTGVLALLFISPHIYWLWQHDWITLGYASNSTVGNLHPQKFNFLSNRITQPIRFLGGLLSATGAFLILCLYWRFMPKTTIDLNPWKKRFIIIMAFSPCVLSILFAILTNSELIPRWATPYFSLWGIVAMLWLKPDFNVVKIRKISLAVCFIFLFGFPLCRGIYLIVSPHYSKKIYSDAYYPAQTIVNTLEKSWQEKFNTPIPYVIGNHYLVTYFSAYAKTPTIPFMDYDLKECPWINLKDVHMKGAVVILKPGFGTRKLLPKLRREFPLIQVLGPYTFEKSFTYLPLPVRAGSENTVTLNIAVIPPEA